MGSRRFSALATIFVLGLPGAVACSDDTAPASGELDAAAAMRDAASDAGEVTALRVPELGPVPELADWEDNPASPEKALLGRTIFHDPRLSASGNSTCNGCHLDLTSFQDALPGSAPDRSFPADRPLTHRHTPSLLNLVYAPIFRWDGSHTDLWDVLAFPFAEANMNLAEGFAADDVEGVDVPSAQRNLKRRFTEDLPGYVGMFEAAFDVDIQDSPRTQVWQLTGKALAVYLRGAVSRDAPFDRWNAGDDDSIEEDAVRGLEVFRGKGRCMACHYGPFFSDFGFHNVSSSPPDGAGVRADEGRFLITGDPDDKGKFLTPTLRATWDTAPYFHDGSKVGLRGVIEHITGDDVIADPLHSPIVRDPDPLTEQEVDDLMAFLKSLRAAAPREVIGSPESFPE